MKMKIATVIVLNLVFFDAVGMSSGSGSRFFFGKSKSSLNFIEPSIEQHKNSSSSLQQNSVPQTTILSSMSARMYEAFLAKVKNTSQFVSEKATQFKQYVFGNKVAQNNSAIAQSTDMPYEVLEEVINPLHSRASSEVAKPIQQNVKLALQQAQQRELQLKDQLVAEKMFAEMDRVAEQRRVLELQKQVELLKQKVLLKEQNKPQGVEAKQEVKVEGEIHSRYEKYIKMRKMLPENAVRQKMALDGFLQAEIDSFIANGAPRKVTSGEVTALSIDPRYEKYVKMQKMLPENAVRQKMGVDGFSKAEIDNFFRDGAPKQVSSLVGSASVSLSDMLAAKKLNTGNNVQNESKVPVKEKSAQDMMLEEMQNRLNARKNKLSLSPQEFEVKLKLSQQNDVVQADEMSYVFKTPIEQLNAQRKVQVAAEQVVREKIISAEKIKFEQELPRLQQQFRENFKKQAGKMTQEQFEAKLQEHMDVVKDQRIAQALQSHDKAITDAGNKAVAEFNLRVKNVQPQQISAKKSIVNKSKVSIEESSVRHKAKQEYIKKIEQSVEQAFKAQEAEWIQDYTFNNPRATAQDIVTAKNKALQEQKIKARNLPENKAAIERAGQRAVNKLNQKVGLSVEGKDISGNTIDVNDALQKARENKVNKKNKKRK